jgi:hypothetical protein
VDSFITPNDPYMTLSQWKEFIDRLLETHNPESYLYTDGGYNNVSLRLRTPEEHKRIMNQHKRKP